GSSHRRKSRNRSRRFLSFRFLSLNCSNCVAFLHPSEAQQLSKLRGLDPDIQWQSGHKEASVLDARLQENRPEPADSSRGESLTKSWDHLLAPFAGFAGP
ncbi:hypothetical protein M5D96_002276, partial [Drosophila gunungcola]